MQIVVRTDASEAIGIGHLNRCLSLAHALRDNGAAVTFACADVSKLAAEMVAEREFPLIKLPRGSSAASAEIQDAENTVAALEDRPFDYAIVDHYGLGAEWERRVREKCRSVLAIDDLASRPHECDILLDQNLRDDNGAAYDLQLPIGCERLMGPRYALLDEAFAKARRRGIGSRDGLLLSFGGSDPQSLTLPVLRALLSLNRPDVPIEVLVGPLNRDVAAIEAFANGAPNVRIHYATKDMAGLMRRVQLYVGAGGSTNWERCCLGVAGVVVAVAKNQENPCQGLAKAGSHVYLGAHDSVDPLAIAHAAMAVLGAAEWRAQLEERSLRLVDGLGAHRVAVRLASGTIHMREATQEDEQRILSWRNHPSVRRYSRSDALISQDDHRRWYAGVLGNSDSHLLVGEDNSGATGVLRYDVADCAARVSIYLVPERLGTGIGSALLAAGERWLSVRRPDVQSLTADVLPGNSASLRLFRDAGYGTEKRTCVRYLKRKIGQ